MCSGSLQTCWGLQSEPDVRRAHKCDSGAGLLIKMREGEPKTSLGLAAGIYWEKMHTARSCQTLLVRQAAHCRPAPLSRALGRCWPMRSRFIRADPIQGCRTLKRSPNPFFVENLDPGLSRRVGNSSGYAVGAWVICARRRCLRRQLAAHGQITERKFIVARFRSSLPRAGWSLHGSIA